MKKKILEFLKYCLVGIVEAIIWLILNPQLQLLKIPLEIISFVVDFTNFNIGFVLKKFVVFRGTQKVKTVGQYSLSLLASLITSAIGMGIVSILKRLVGIPNDNIVKGLSVLILFFAIYPINRFIFKRK